MEEIYLSKTTEPVLSHQRPNGPSPPSSLSSPPEQAVESSPSSAIEPLPAQILDGSSPAPPLQTAEDCPLSPTSPPHGETINDFSNSSFNALSETLEDDPSPSPHSPGRNPSGSEAKPSISPCIAYETKPSLVGAGLANLGNTCFLNAVLQCFTHTVPLVQGLRSCNHDFPCDRSHQEFCVLCVLREHIELSLASSGGIISPLRFFDNLSYFSSFFQRYQQEDAHEFLQCLLDKLDCCILDSKKQVKFVSSLDGNLVNEVFGGRLISKLRCCNCNHCSDSYESIIDLSLEIKDMETLPHALESFTKVEKIGDPEMKFTCENCKEEVSVEKQFLLDQAPSVATFHLKRFKSDGFYVDKIDKHVAYPLELDLQPYISGSQTNNVELKYELYAVVVHVGLSSNSGHYFCFIRSSPDTWHRLDDSKVTGVREDFVLSQEAYILFYARQGTHWFSSLMETQKSCMESNFLGTSPKSVLDNVDNISSFSPSVANIQSPMVNDRDPTEGRFSSETNPGIEANGVEPDTCVIHAQTQLEPSACCDRTTSYNVEKRSYPSPTGEKIYNQMHDEFRHHVNIHPQTPPRSPSPDIYFEEPREAHLIPRDHLNLDDQVSCKRTLNHALEDSKKKEAAKYMKKTMPTARSMQLMAAMMGSRSENSLKKRSKRRMASPPNGEPSSSTRRKSCPNSMMNPVVAGIFP
ncbi:ubiquitin carboxyl-terminal hydrolase 21-like isoform X2 [Malania oleifera]|uniref:ubiquitin carboxyl-terminal hydrolase 21-like isoform X2 n=1 Tax=Malania oleifera TaxID=397392 RepID=UPI0025ADCB48|nr:ubiquitin carboxyl-terminal hydrolase 21-like isoform X2 [Malania oleifera]